MSIALGDGDGFRFYLLFLEEILGLENGCEAGRWPLESLQFVGFAYFPSLANIVQVRLSEKP